MLHPAIHWSYINPSDIESISVLKDADATAIYRSRAANSADDIPLCGKTLREFFLRLFLNLVKFVICRLLRYLCCFKVQKGEKIIYALFDSGATFSSCITPEKCWMN